MKTKTFKNKNIYGVLVLLIMGWSSMNAQLNTNLGQNAGNTGVFNTSIGGFAGDKVTGNANTFLGHYSGANLINGNDNTLIGFFSGYSLTSGKQNVFIGRDAGRNVTTGSYNSFLGNSAGHNLSRGSNNVFIGRQAGYTASNLSDLTFVGTRAGYYNTGLWNTFVGFEAGLSNRGSNNNTFIGYKAGRSTTGYENTFLGSRAGERNTTGVKNVFLGSGAGGRNTTGTNNTFVGTLAGRSNTTGNGNVFFGIESGFRNTKGFDNAFIGSAAGANNTEGIYNSFIGDRAGVHNTKGNRNTFIGRNAGKMNSTGSDNVYIGYNAGATTDTSNKLYIANRSNTIPLIYGDFSTGRIGLGTITPGSHRLYVAGTAFATGLWLSSDKRFKKDRKKVEKALDKINNLEGVTYIFKKSAKTKDFNLPDGMQYGLMAQELEKVVPELVQEDEKGYKAVNYIGLIPVLIEAIKELNTNNKVLKKEIEDLKSQQTNAVQSGNIESKPEDFNSIEEVKLYQNTPNPFDQTTSISYELPNDITNASIHIFDMQGTQKKVFRNLSGKNSITIKTGELHAGMYMYSLIINGRIIDTKKMLLAK